MRLRFIAVIVRAGASRPEGLFAGVNLKKAAGAPSVGRASSTHPARSRASSIASAPAVSSGMMPAQSLRDGMQMVPWGSSIQPPENRFYSSWKDGKRAKAQEAGTAEVLRAFLHQARVARQEHRRGSGSAGRLIHPPTKLPSRTPNWSASIGSPRVLIANMRGEEAEEALGRFTRAAETPRAVSQSGP